MINLTLENFKYQTLENFKIPSSGISPKSPLFYLKHLSYIRTEQIKIKITVK
jgi:hypothetical protein